MSHPPFIWDSSQADYVPPEGMDALWSKGWRHFGTEFFRYSISVYDGNWQTVAPLRLPLAELDLTKSQRRVLRKNKDVECRVAPARITDEAEAMFQRHKARFKENVPETLRTFLSPEPWHLPCQCLEFQCWLEGRLVAMSYLDIGANSVSAVYGMFEPEPDLAWRSLGIFTLLQEMQWAKDHGKTWHYPGYATLGSSAYDYKKQFRGLLGYHWRNDQWLPWAKLVAESSEGRTGLADI